MIRMYAICLSCLVGGLLLVTASAIGAQDWNEPARGVGNWPEELGTQKPRSLGDGSKVKSLGNHRAVVKVSGESDAVAVRIPWRRRDTDANQKATLIYDAKTDKQIENAVRSEINREYGDIIFQPTSGAGEYYVYYMPYTYRFYEGSGDYRTEYDAPETTSDAEWLTKNGLADASGKWKELPKAEVVEIQARTDFDRFDPMEVCATHSELSQLAVKHPGRSYLTFPEDRINPIRMKSDIPLKWIKSGPGTEFRGEACRNEFYPFQIGLYALNNRLFRINVEMSDLKTKDGRLIPASAIRCFNSGGIDQNGKSFSRSLSVEKRKVLPLWIGVQVPKDAVPGTYEGTVTIRPRNGEETKVHVALKVTNQLLEDCGDSELWRHSRLRWLDSTIGIDDNVSVPYTPVQVKGQTVSVLLREIRFGANGLPESITSKGQEVLARPIRLVAETDAGPVQWKDNGTKLIHLVPARAVMETTSTSEVLALRCLSTTEYDGFAILSLHLNARKAVDLKNVSIEIPYRREVTTYFMGQAQKERGGLRPSSDMNELSRNVWLGDVHAGMQATFQSGKNTIREVGDEVVLFNEVGDLSLKPGEERQILLQLLVTPLKPLDPDHWNWRYAQAWMHAIPPTGAEKDRVKVLNLHHANEYNPYINYPFLTDDLLLEYSTEAHERGMRTKYYYTLRELTQYAAEIWAFRAVEPNMFPNKNQRGGYSWLQEHLFEDYNRAWHTWSANTEITDAAVHTTGDSRLMNYYLEGLNWLTKHLGNDGLYIDGLAYDRSGMRRVRKALDSAKPGCIIDFHCGRIGSNTNIFMKHLPYIDSIWFGEGFDYDDKPDYWLTEAAGIPLGLWGEMLGSGNPWRGMLYGMTNRLGWGGDARAIWELWDDFGIHDSKMIGYWEKDCPVRTGLEDVPATVYVKKDKALISIGSWAKEPTDVRLSIDWEKLGFKPGRLNAPAIKDFQEERTFTPTEAIPVPKGKGWLLLLGNSK